MLSRLKMSQKIIGGFFVVVLMLGTAIAMQIMAMQKLTQLKLEMGARAADTVDLGHIMETLDMSYGTIINAIYSLHTDRTSTQLAELDSQVSKDAVLILTKVETDEEKAWASEYLSNFKEYLAIFNDQVRPLQKTLNGDTVKDESTMKTINELNSRMDEKRALADSSLNKIILSLTKKMENADAVFTKTANQSITLASIIAILSASIAMVLAFFLARGITRPINECVRNLTSGSEQIAAAAGQVSTASQTLAEGASEQAAALEETSASTEELNSMTRQNADNAYQADALMKQSLTTITNTNTAMTEMDRSMTEISTASEQTFKIIKTIDEIAFQTNLLALNAAVEAARAGEAGAGFAVVADEVRNLAMRATEAAKNTANLIEDTVKKVAAGKEIVSKVTEAFQEVTESSTKVGSLLGEISAASKEQAQGIGQISQAITQMDSVTQQNAGNSEESAAAAEELSSQAENMIDIVMALHALVEGQQQGGNRSPRATKPVPPPPRSPALRRPQLAARPASKPALAAPPPMKKAPMGPVRKQPAAANPEVVIPMGDDDNFEDF